VSVRSSLLSAVAAALLAPAGTASAQDDDADTSAVKLTV
jgi:hypothetical protein